MVGLVEVVKRLGLPSKFAPVLSVALGLILGFFTYSDPTQALLVGGAFGLSASGLYSGGKAVLSK